MEVVATLTPLPVLLLAAKPQLTAHIVMSVRMRMELLIITTTIMMIITMITIMEIMEDMITMGITFINFN